MKGLTPIMEGCISGEPVMGEFPQEGFDLVWCWQLPYPLKVPKALVRVRMSILLDILLDVGVKMVNSPPLVRSRLDHLSC